MRMDFHQPFIIREMQLDLIKVTASPPPLSAIVRFLFLYLKTEIIIWILKLFPTALHSRSTQWTYVYNKRSVFVFSLLFRRRGESIATAARVYRLLTMIFPFKSDTHTYTYNNYTNFSFIFFFLRASVYVHLYNQILGPPPSLLPIKHARTRRM
jgi:hypothetical protein